MKTFLISIPKSGTYLMRELLSEILVDSHLHVIGGGVYDYSRVSVEEGRRNPQSCFIPMTFSDVLSFIPEGSFAMGHLGYSEDREKQLEGFRLLLMKRDFEECALSGMRWLLRTGRALKKYRNTDWIYESDPYAQFQKFMDIDEVRLRKEYDDILKWEDRCEVFDYNEVLRDPDGQIERLGRIYDFDFNDRDINQIRGAIGRKTLTRI